MDNGINLKILYKNTTIIIYFQNNKLFYENIYFKNIYKYKKNLENHEKSQ